MSAAHTTIDYVAGWATFGTAIGTIGLASATFVLARKTRALAGSTQQTADAAKQQTKAAEGALNASLRPLIIDIPRHTTRTIQLQDRPGEKRPVEIDLSVISSDIAESTRTGSLTVPVRNVGPGVALGLAAAVTFAHGDLVGAPVARGEAPSVIAPGEPEAIWFEDTAGPASAAAETPLVRLLKEGEDLVVEIAYSDVAGRVSASSLTLTKSGTTDRTHRVTRVDPGHEPRLTVDQV